MRRKRHAHHVLTFFLQFGCKTGKIFGKTRNLTSSGFGLALPGRVGFGTLSAASVDNQDVASRQVRNMSAPATVASFLELVQRSGLLEKAALDACCADFEKQGPLPENPRALADLMIKGGVLTNFQAEKLLV